MRLLAILDLIFKGLNCRRPGYRAGMVLLHTDSAENGNIAFL